jgi:hypothetical protein
LLALAPGVQTEFGQRDHDLITIDQAETRSVMPVLAARAESSSRERAAV